MRIEYEGESYEFEMADITVKQAIKIEKYLGCPIAEFGDRLDSSGGKNPDLMAMQCLGWLILHGGRGVPIEDTDFSIARLTAAIAAAAPPAGEEAAAAVPTVAAGTSPNGAGVIEGQLIAR